MLTPTEPTQDALLGMRSCAKSLDRIALLLRDTRNEPTARRAMDLVRQSLGILGAVVRGSDARVLADQHARTAAEFLTYLGR